MIIKRQLSWPIDLIKGRYSRTEEFTVPGIRITDQQVTIYMKHRKRNSQVIAAAKAGISERSVRRIDKLDEQPLSNKRQWRTHIDPLDSIWNSIVEPLLQSDGTLTPVGIFDHLCEFYTDKFNPSSRHRYFPYLKICAQQLKMKSVALWT